MRQFRQLLQCSSFKELLDSALQANPLELLLRLAEFENGFLLNGDRSQSRVQQVDLDILSNGELTPNLIELSIDQSLDGKAVVCSLNNLSDALAVANIEVQIGIFPFYENGELVGGVRVVENGSEFHVKAHDFYGEALDPMIDLLQSAVGDSVQLNVSIEDTSFDPETSPGVGVQFLADTLARVCASDCPFPLESESILALAALFVLESLCSTTQIGFFERFAQLMQQKQQQQDTQVADPVPQNVEFGGDCHFGPFVRRNTATTEVFLRFSFFKMNPFRTRELYSTMR